MSAALELEHGVGAVAADLEGHVLEAADLGCRLRQRLGGEAALLGVAGEHVMQVAGKERGLVAPGPAADLDDHVLVVVGVAVDHRQTQLVLELPQPLGGIGDHLAQLLVLVVGEQLAGAVEVAAQPAPFARQDLGVLEVVVGAAHFGIALAVGDHLGVRHLALELGKTLLDLRDELLDHAQSLTPEPAVGSAACYNPGVIRARPITLGLIALVVAALAGLPGAGAAPSCLGHAPTIVDGAGSSRIQGTQGGDVIFAGAGNDTVAGGDGVDYVCGGDGDDTIDTGTGDDFIDGGDGADEIHGYNGDDRIEGGAGRDFLDGRRGREDVLLAGPGPDRLIGGSVLKGGAGNDRLDSAGYRRETGADRLDGGGGDDRLLGDSQNGPGERLDGGSGDDDLKGFDGDDSLAGGGGIDQLDGGDGSDSCSQGPGSGPVTNCE